MGSTWVRGAVFIAAVIYMQATPLWVTGLGQKRPSGFRPWQMYHGVGHEECKLKLFAMEGDERTPVAWSTMVPKDEGDKTRSIVKHRDGVKLVKDLCNAYPSNVGLAVVTICAEKRHWLPPSNTLDVDICRRGKGAQ